MTEKIATIYLTYDERFILYILSILDDIYSRYNIKSNKREINVTEKQLSDILYFMDERGFVGNIANKFRDKLQEAGRNVFNWE